MALWRSPKPVDRPGPRLLRRRRHRLRAVLATSSCAPRTAASATRRRASGARRRRRCGSYRLGLERSKRLLLTGDALDGRTRGRVGAGLRGRARGRARRRRRWRSRGAWRCCPHNQLQHDEAAGQPGLRADGPARRRSSSARCSTARRATRPRARPSRSARCATSAAPWPSATRRSATTARARDGVAMARRSLGVGPRRRPRPAHRRRQGDRSSSRAGRCCTTRSNVLRAVLDEVAVVAKRRPSLPGLDVDVAIWLEAEEPRHPLAGIVHALRCARGQPVVRRGRRHAARDRAGSSRRSRASARAARPPWCRAPAGACSRCARATSRGR